MNILMLTNTYLPHVGGVAESVERFSRSYAAIGHKVLVVAPWFEGCHDDTSGVLRVPAWEHLLGSDFSLPLPVPRGLYSNVHDFSPDVVHSHHPFLLGDTALRIAALENVPVVFTHHTQYDIYTHYIGGNTDFIRRLASEIAIGYANLCNAVIAPSESICERLQQGGVTSRIKVIPTGVDVERFASGNRVRFRKQWCIPNDALIVGHVGRLAAEKNLDFLARACAELLATRDNAWMVVAGQGPLSESIVNTFNAHGVGDRLVMLGVLDNQQLYDTYAGMDVFAFASQSETQGMVLAEAMSAGTPVVAVDAPGVREIVRDGENGRLLGREDEQDFVAALHWFACQSPHELERLTFQARATANRFSIEQTSSAAIALYSELIDAHPQNATSHNLLQELVRRASQECRLWANVVEAGAIAAFDRGDMPCSHA